MRDRYLFYLAPLLLLGERALPDGRPPPPPRDRRSDGVLQRDRLLRRLRSRRGPVGGLARVGAERGAPRRLRPAADRRVRRPLWARARRGVRRPGALVPACRAPRRDDRGLRLRRERRRLRVRAPADEQHAAGDPGHRPAASAGLGRPLGRPHGRAARLPGLPGLGPERDRLVGRRALEQPRPAGVRRSGRHVDVHALPRRVAPARLRARGVRRHGATRRRSCSRPRTTLASSSKGEATTSNVGLVLLKAERPYRVSWASRGLEPDGWTRPGRPATVRIYGKPGAATVEALLDAPPEATAPTTYRLGERKLERWIPVPGRPCGRPSASPRQGHADLTLETGRSATVDGPPIGPEPGPSRDIGLALSGVDRERPARPAHRRITACPTTTKAAAAFRTASTRAASPTGSTSGSSTTRSTRTTARSSRRATCSSSRPRTPRAGRSARTRAASRDSCACSTSGRSPSRSTTATACT